MTKLLAILISFTAIQASFAMEFSNFALKNELKALNEVKKPTDESSGFSIKAASSNRQESTLRTMVSQKLLGLTQEKAAAGTDLSPLFQKITQSMTNYRQIGKQETTPLVYSHDMGGGVMNYSGFQWQKPFANFSIYADRQVTRRFGGGWIVHDKLIVSIDASTFLSNLQEADLIDITKEQLAAFAGISFRREYLYNHFAATFLAGLQSDYSRLFMPYLKFSPEYALTMPENHFLKLSDKLTFNAGGAVNYPPTSGISARAGVLVGVAHQRDLSLYTVNSVDRWKDDEFLRLGFSSKTEKSAQASLSMQADFFNIVKLTLLEAELDYKYGKTNTTKLSFYDTDRDLIKHSPAHRAEFNRLVRGRSEQVVAFKNNLLSLEERLQQNLDSSFSFLLFGTAKKLGTEQIKVVKDGIEKVIFRHTAESVRFIQNLWSRIYGIVIRKLFKFDTIIANAAQATKTMTVEFEHMEELGQARVDGTDKFSVVLSQNFQAARTHRWWHGFYRREAQSHLKKMTNLEKVYREMVDDRKLRGPLEVASKVHIMAPALDHFNRLEKDKAFKIFEEVCEGGRSCLRLLKRKYSNYSDELRHRGVIDLMRFKSFIGSYFKRIRNYKDLHPLFGEKNVFMSGSFRATKSDGMAFTTYFKEGDFQGLGLVDSFMRQGVNRAPANISAK